MSTPLVIGMSERGEIVPPPDVLRRLHEIHADLGLMTPPVGQGVWCVTLRWREDDPRHALIRSGEIAPHPYDAIGYLPQGISFDDVPAYIERSLRSSKREDARRAAESVRRHNAAVTDTAMAQPFEQALEIAQHVGAAALVTGDASRRRVRVRSAGVPKSDAA